MKKLLAVFFVFLLGTHGSFLAARGAPDSPFSRHDERNAFVDASPQELQIEEEMIGLTGNWGGARRMLDEKGVIITSSYVNDLVGNPVGGRHRGFTNAGSFGLNLELHFGKLIGSKGLHFFGSFVFRHGTSLSAKRIDNQFPVQQDFGSQTYRLNEWYLKQTLFEERLTLKAGRLDGGNDFLQSPLYYQFTSNAFDGNPVGVFFNIPFTAYPIATWGAYVDGKPFERLFIRLAIYNNNVPVTQNRYHGINFSFASPGGAMIMTEWSYQVNQLPKDTGLPGNYRVGYYYITANTPKFEGGKANNNYGYYFLIDQTIYRYKGGGKDQGLTPFAALLFAPKDRNTFPFFFTAGFVFKGIVPNRTEDALSFGIAYGHYSTDLRHVEQIAKRTKVVGPFGDKPQNFETSLELNYWVQVNKWLSITPDLQYVINPKGFGNIPSAFVIGTQVGVTL